MAASTKKKVSVLGLGKLGACYAAFYASKGYDTLGYDINPHSVAAINAGKPPVEETNLASYVSKNRSRLAATDNIARLITETDVTFMIVPTPSKKDGLFSMDAVRKAATAMGQQLKHKKKYHTFVLVSTVLPGDSRNEIIPAFERASGKTCGSDFGYIYSPSLIALGNVLRNLEDPDVLIFGAFDERSQRSVEPMYKHIYPRAHFEVISIEEAELAKISINSFITMRLSFANTLGLLCEAMPGTNVDAVTRVVGNDSRIGRKYFSAGLGFGGPCFPRDNKAFSMMARRFGVPAGQASETDRTNEIVLKRLTTYVEKKVSRLKRPTIGFLSLSYKPGTANVEESQALSIAQVLARKYRIAVYDPQGSRESKSKLDGKVTYVSSLQALVTKSDVVFLSNPDASFASLPKLLKGKKILIDPWGMFRKAKLGPNVEYCAPGRARVL